MNGFFVKSLRQWKGRGNSRLPLLLLASFTTIPAFYLLSDQKKTPSITFLSSSRRFRPHYYAICEGEEAVKEQQEAAIKPSVEPIHLDENESDDKDWEQEKLKCSFCRSFLQSPCKEPFKRWSKCVDKAKSQEADFTQACVHYTRALMACTEENEAYFHALHRDMQEKEKENEEKNEEAKNGKEEEQEEEKEEDEKGGENQNDIVEEKEGDDEISSSSHER